MVFQYVNAHFISDNNDERMTHNKVIAKISSAEPINTAFWGTIKLS